MDQGSQNSPDACDPWDTWESWNDKPPSRREWPPAVAVHVIGGILFGVASVVAFFAFLFSGFLNSYCTKSPGEGGTRRVFDATIGMFLAALAGLIAAAVSWRRGNPMVWVRLVVVVLVGTALVVVLNRPMHYCWF